MSVPLRLLIASALLSAVMAPTAGAATVAAGASHTVVVTPDNTVWVWGTNGNGQLGDSTTISKAVPTPLPTLSGIVAVAAGGSHTLALKNDGTVYAWGANGYGQLGDNTTTQRTSPVVANVTGIVAIAAGEHHSVALASDGRLWVWGRNSYGQVGKGSTSTSEPTPLMVSSLTAVTAIGAGAQHTLTVKSDGTVWSFGQNTNGQLGDATTTNAPSPVQMTGVTGASSVAGGLSHSLVLKTDGTLRAVGYNAQGQLGEGSTTQRTTAVTVTGVSTIALVVAGQYHSMAAKTDGTLLGWGYNAQGQLGDGTTTNRSLATTISTLATIDKVAAGSSHTLAVTTAGVVSTWGGNSFSQLGDGTTTGRTTPVPISGASYAWKVGTPVFSIAAGTYTTEKTVVITCATTGATLHYTLDGAEPTEADPTVASGGSVVIDQSRTLRARAWSGTMPPSEIATAVYTLQVSTVTFTPASGTYTSAPTITLTTATPAATLRYTTDGSTPTGASPAYSAPFVVPTTTTVRAAGFRTGWTTSSVTIATYTMNFGTLAAPTFDPAPGTHVSSVTVTLTAFAGAALRHTTNGSTPTTGSPLYTAPLVLTATTTLKAIATHPDYMTSPVTTGVFTLEVAAPVLSPTGGTYAAGQLVTVSTATTGATIRYTTTGLEPTESDLAIASGDTLPVGNFTLKARAWKTGATTSATTTAVYAVTGAVTTATLAGGEAHSLAVRGDGTVFAWGANTSGQIGDGSTTRRVNPVLVNGLSGVIALGGGSAHSVALRSDGRVLTWGDNSQGQLGTGTGPARTVPGLVSGLTSVMAISVGRDHTLALKSDGTVVAWGANTSGQLGNGGRPRSPRP